MSSRLSSSAWRRLASSSFSASLRWLFSTIFSCFWSWSARCFEQVLLLVEMAFAFECFLPGVVELVFDPGLFAKGQLLGLDFGFLVAGGGLDFRLFENLVGFLLGVLLSQIAEQLDDAHAHDRGDQRDAR